MNDSLLALILGFTAVFVSLSVHEFFHAWVANYLGDPTAKYAGRLTLNPMAHIDPFGTFLLPLLLLFLGLPPFGYAKPVPVNPNNFKNRRIGEILTSIAGPISNLGLFIFFAAIFKILPPQESVFTGFVISIMVINLFLMVFNLIPIPPLDGSKVLLSVLPYRTAVVLETYGPFFLIAFIMLSGGAIIRPLVNIILNLFGIPLNLF